MFNIAHLECSKCGDHSTPESLQTVCPKDNGSLYVRYDLNFLKSRFTRESLLGRAATIWRYKEVLPGTAPISLGEGFSPLIPFQDIPNLFIKDEGLNPTGSFKARGLSVGITMARHYGLTHLVLPSAGNAAGALAAYCAAAAIKAHIFMPKDAQLTNLLECRAYGAHVTLIEGTVSDCVKVVEECKHSEGWFDISSLKEPFRLEGKKTMGYEMAEQLGWKLPDAVLFPTGGGVGLIGIWKAFDEMEELQWIGNKRPKMIAVQAEGCAPIVKAWNDRKSSSEQWQKAHTIASGLRVPKPYGDYLVLEILKKSAGTAIAVSDQQIVNSMRQLALRTGILTSPEGAACFAAYKSLCESSFLSPRDNVVIFNTASGLKYIAAVQDVLNNGSSSQHECYER